MSAKVASSDRWVALKTELRRSVLARVRPCRVLDLFSGRGGMWGHVWRHAEHYLGVDQRMWRSDEPHRRLIMDNREACRTLDLDAFNVFDLDAYGEPFSVALLIADRRRWLRGEVGALVLTDGSSLRNRMSGGMAKVFERLIPTHPDVDLHDVTGEMHRQAVGAWCERCGVTPTWFEMGGGATGRKGGIMFYSAVVFEGSR